MKIHWLLMRINAYYYNNMFCKYYPIQFQISQERSLKNHAAQTSKLVCKAARKKEKYNFIFQYTGLILYLVCCHPLGEVDILP